MSVTLEEIVQAALNALPGAKKEALRILRGESERMDATAGGTLPAEPFLTLRDIAKQLGVSPCTLWRWKIPGHDLGGRRRYKRSEVEAFICSEEFRRRTASLRAERKQKLAKRTDKNQPDVPKEQANLPSPHRSQHLEVRR